MIVHTTGAAELPSKLKMLVCGTNGSGKTRFAATFPNPIFANCLGGMLALADKNMRYVNIHEEADLLKLKLKLETGEMLADTIVIDTLDEFQRILLAERLFSERRGETNASDFGWLGQRMHTIVDGLCSMDLNVVMLCHTKDVSDGVSGQLFIKPGLQGAFADQIGQYVDFALLIQARAFQLNEPSLTEEMGSDDPYFDPATFYDYRCLVTYPTAIHDWVKDATGTLPSEVPLNFESDYQTIRDAVENRRSELVARTSAPVSSSDGEQLTVYDALNDPGVGRCTECDSPIESQDQLDLAIIRYRTPLCSKCYSSNEPKG
jgi:AAA domain